MKRMVKLVLILQLLTLALNGQECLNIMFWNLENFFDCNDTKQNSSDTEFSPAGAKHWTKRRFYAKCNTIAKSILWISEQYGRPDVIGVAEVENKFVLKKLVENTALKKLDYGIVHYDSPDPRGIDVALLYNKERLKLISSKPIRTDGVTTRDILLAKLMTEGGNYLNILVNHHPSKYGGKQSIRKREAVVNRLKEVCDSLSQNDVDSKIIAMGDFNESYDNQLFDRLSLVNVARNSPWSGRDVGTIRYMGEWELIDLFFVSEEIKNYRMNIVRVPFLQTRDNAFPGEKPLRTYVGPNYMGGVSDHYPVCLELSL